MLIFHLQSTTSPFRSPFLFFVIEIYEIIQYIFFYLFLPFFLLSKQIQLSIEKKNKKMNQNRMVQNVLKSFTTSMDNIYKGSRRKKKTQTRHRH